MDTFLKHLLKLPSFLILLWLVAFLIISDYLSKNGPNIVALMLGVVPFLFVYVGYSAALCSTRSRIDERMKTIARKMSFTLSVVSIASISVLYLFFDTIDTWFLEGSQAEWGFANALVTLAFLSQLTLMWIAAGAANLSTGASKGGLFRRVMWLVALAYLPIGVFFLRPRVQTMLSLQDPHET